MTVPRPRDNSSKVPVPGFRAAYDRPRAATARTHAQALASEATTRRLLDDAREMLARSHELLEQVRRGRESTAREAATILERVQRQDAEGASRRDGVSGDCPDATKAWPRR